MDLRTRIVEMDTEATLRSISESLTSALAYIRAVPGADIVINYIKSSYQNDPFRIFLEVLLAIFTLKYLMSKRYKPKSNFVELSNKVI